MTFRFLDRASQSMATTPGTGSLTLGGALAGYQTFSQAGVNNNDTFSYLIVDGTNWEYGVGTYTAIGVNGTLARTTITKTSAQNTSPINVSSKANVSAILRAEDVNAGGTLQGLADVSINEAILTNGQVLAWNLSGGTWDAASISVSGTLHGLSDVNVTEGAEIDGYTLNWNNTAGAWEAVAPVSPSGGPTSGAGTAKGSSTAQGNLLVNQNSGGGGGSSIAVSNNGTSVDTAATTLNFVNATSITVASHDVTITLPTGGGGSPYIGGSPPTIVQSGAVQGSGVNSITLGAAPTNGNLLIAFLFDTGSNPTAGSGWTQLALSTSGALDGSIYTKTAGASESATQTPSSSTGGSTALMMWELSGVSTGIEFSAALGASYVAYPTASTPVLPAQSGTVCLAALAPTSASVAVSSAYGLHTQAILSGSGLPAAWGNSDSTNSQSYGLAANLASSQEFGYCIVVVH